MEEIYLVDILMNLPKWAKLYSTIYGEVELISAFNGNCEAPITIYIEGNKLVNLTPKGHYYSDNLGECILFPSKDNRDWSTFKVEKPKFDVKTLQPFDKVLCRENDDCIWINALFSYINKGEFVTTIWRFSQCIPYNEETKYLLGTTNDAPEYYKTW